MMKKWFEHTMVCSICGAWSDDLYAKSDLPECEIGKLYLLAARKMMKKMSKRSSNTVDAVVQLILGFMVVCILIVFILYTLTAILG